MSPVRAAVLGVGAATVVLKATGPVLLGRRELPSWLAGPVFLLAPAVLAAFVVTQAVGGDRRSPPTLAWPASARAPLRSRCARRSWRSSSRQQPRRR